ncbi:restriction endonuclease subunit S [Acetobacter cerevisiae]|uniref:restriction endonuclease subunit S n=1 Tax=Acetobacter cerevisiae TaxID=178900 RepID=UPI0034270F36
MTPSRPKFLPVEFSNKIKGSQLKKGDVLINLVGASIGRSCLYKKNFPHANINQAVCTFRTNSYADPHFLALFFQYPKTIDRLICGQNASARPNISLGDIKNFEVLLPPLPEQKKIAAILSTWDRAIEGTEKLLANSQQQKKALMQQLLTGKKRLPGFTGEWKTVTIGSLLKEAKRPVEWKDDNFYKLLSVKRRSEGVILREVLHGTKILTKKMNYAKSGDFLISKMQVVHGASGLVPEHLDNHHISDSYIALRAKNPEKFDIEFFSWLSKERVMYHKTFLCSYGVTIEKMTFNFNMYLKENIKIPPTVTEQRSISQLLNTTENEITALESDLSRLRQEKKALMQQLLTGKRRVTVD